MKDHNHLDQKTKEDVIRRISIANGHLEKVKKMLESNEYCPHVIHQSQAVQASLRKVDEIILEKHLHNCVLKNLEANGEKRKKLAAEIIEVFKKKK